MELASHGSVLCQVHNSGKSRYPNPHVREAGAMLARFCGCQVAAGLVSSTSWGRPAGFWRLKAVLFGDGGARGCCAGAGEGKKVRPLGEASRRGERAKRGFDAPPLGEGGGLGGQGEDRPDLLHARDGFRAGAKAQAQRRARMALAPRTVQNIPERLRREATTVLHPASMTPEPTKRCWRRNLGYRMRSAFRSK